MRYPNVHTGYTIVDDIADMLDATVTKRYPEITTPVATDREKAR